MIDRLIDCDNSTRCRQQCRMLILHGGMRQTHGSRRRSHSGKRALRAHTPVGAHTHTPARAPAHAHAHAPTRTRAYVRLRADVRTRARLRPPARARARLGPLLPPPARSCALLPAYVRCAPAPGCDDAIKGPRYARERCDDANDKRL